MVFSVTGERTLLAVLTDLICTGGFNARLYGYEPHTLPLSYAHERNHTTTERGAYKVLVVVCPHPRFQEDTWIQTKI